MIAVDVEMNTPGHGLNEHIELIDLAGQPGCQPVLELRPGLGVNKERYNVTRPGRRQRLLQSSNDSGQDFLAGPAPAPIVRPRGHLWLRVERRIGDNQVETLMLDRLVQVALPGLDV